LHCSPHLDNEKSSLVEAQKALNGIEGDLKKVDGVKGVQRVVCGGCLDFKVSIVKLLEGSKAVLLIVLFIQVTL
jgi:hypothetical protein